MVAKFAGNATYCASQDEIAQLKINPVQVTVTVDPNQRKVYGSADPAQFTYTHTALLPGDNMAGALSRTPGENVGTYPITQGTLVVNDGNNGDNYAINFIGNNFEITPATLTITVTPGQRKAYGETDPVLSYTHAGLKPGDNLSGALSRMPGENLGLYPVTKGTLTVIDGNSGNNYNLTLITTNFEITKATVIVTADAGQAKVYGDTDPVLTYTTQPSINPALITGNLARVAGENAGQYAINQGTLAIADNNYQLSFVGNNFEITKATVTVTADAGQTKVYGNTDPVFTYTTLPAVSPGLLTGSLSRVAGENVGLYAINQGTLAITDNNYQLAFVSNDFEITKATLTVTANAGQAKAYGQSDPLLTYTTHPAVSPGLLTGSLSRVAGENVGLYAINQGTLAVANNNYQLAFVSNDFEITRVIVTVTANAGQVKVYGETDPILTYTAQPSINPALFTGSLSRVAGEDIGLYAINQGTLAITDNNYQLSFVSNDFAIVRAIIIVTVTADAGQTKIYGEADPVLTYTTQPSINPALLTGSLSRVAGENVGLYAINQGTLAITDNNYRLSFVSNDFEITKATLTVTADAGQTKVYGETDPVFTYTAQPSIDSALFTGSLARVTGENVGLYAINQGTLSAGNNYTITFVSNDFAITKAPQVITFTPLVDLPVNTPPFNLEATASSGLPVSYTSSNPAVATVDANGKVTLHSVGQVVITASQSGNNNYLKADNVTQAFNVLRATVISIEVLPNEADIVIGDNIQLEAVIRPSDVVDKTVTWTTSDPYIATVDANGNVTGHKYGTVTITATANDGGLSASAIIRVHTVDIDKDTKFPQGFSPDGDGINDFFVIDGIEKRPLNNFYVFDRGGKLHYKMESYKNDWDGTANVGPYKGRKVPPGTYFYILRFGDASIKRSFIVIKY